MACIAHHCYGCKHLWESNTIRPTCPKCGGWNVTNHFDEDGDEDRAAEIRAEVYEDLRVEA